MESVAEKLKELIDENGPKYLTEEPYKVYKELIRTKTTDKKTAGALLMLFVSGIMETVTPDDVLADMSKRIQRECCFNKKMADALTVIVLSLHSHENEEEWNNKNFDGLIRFKKEKLKFKWEGFSTWREHGGSVDCYYHADLILSAREDLVIDKELTRSLKKNPFMKVEAIRDFYENKIKEHLDYEFEEYCMEDDYYQPVVEDFDCEYHLEKWCKEHGFELISCNGEGRDGGYEPDYVRNRWR